MLGRLSGAVIHDLNNLLTVIQLNAGMIEEGGFDARETIAAAGKIGEASRSAAELTRKVLNFARGRPHETENVHLQDLVAGLARLLQPLMANKVTVAIGLGERELWVNGNRGAIEQAVMNLVLNAVDAMPQGGTVTITFLDRPAEASGAARGRQVGIMVRDEGAGIPAECRARIFEPLFTTKEQGTGMGLAIVDRIVRLHRGFIEFDSTPGKGAEFRIWFPEVVPAAPADMVDAPAAQGEAAGRTVLLVEDDPGILALARHLLESLGMTVLPAANGEAGWLLWQAHAGGIDLLFTDIVLPGALSGRELAEKILGSRPDLPVLYTSGYSNAGSNQSYLHDGNFLPKPFPADTLQRAVRLALARASRH